MHDFEPWMKYPPLTRQRLSALAGVMREVREKAVPLHDPHAGDNPWSLGCRIYARTCFALREFSAKHDWLAILPENEALRFTFSIGRVPLKFYRGDVGDAPGHCKVLSDAEALAKQLLLDLEGIEVGDRLLRLVVAGKDVEGQAVSVILTELDKGGKLTGKYLIPFDADEGTALSMLAPGIDPGPPSVQPLPQAGGASEQQDKRRKRNE